MKKRVILFLMMMGLAACMVFAGGNKEEVTDEVSAAPEAVPSLENEGDGLQVVAEQLGVSQEELAAALGDPSQGAPDFDAAAAALGVSADELEEAMKSMMPAEESVTVNPYTAVINGVEFEIVYQLFTWDILPSDVNYERLPVEAFTSENGDTHFYEVIYVKSGNLNWYQAAKLAEDAGGYMACPTTDAENSFIFSLVDDMKFFWAFEEDGDHAGISIGPFLGGYQPEGSEEPAGGWSWLSGEAWEYTNWAVNLDDGVIDKDPRPNDQPNNSGDGQPIMGFGEMNLPVPTWGDYMDAVGTYGVTRGPGNSYGFIIEYEKNPQ